MYIAPDSTIKLLSGCPLNNSYEDTFYWASEAAQRAYFEGLTYRTFENQQYQRVTKNTMRLQISPYLVYECNYLMFRNRAWSTKWFYAFITNVEYVNNECAEITYELDVMQTWFFEAKLKQCYVVREHSATDRVGSSLTAEPIDTGKIICTGYKKYGLTGYSVVITIADADGETGQQAPGIYSPLRYVIYSQFQQADLDTYFNQIVTNNLQDSVVGVTVMPSAFIDEAGNINPYGTFSVNKPTKVDGYTPRNKKLLTSPYCYLAVDVLNDANAYNYEWFSSDNCVFDVWCYVSPEVQISCTPVDYNGGAGATEELVMRGFPQLPFIIDSYRAWLAQNSTSDMLGIAGTVLGGVAGTAAAAGTGNLVGAATTAINAVIGTAQQVNQAKINQTKGDRARGTQTGGLDMARGVKDIYFKTMSVSRQYAEIIDDFFDRYGYACCENKVPGRANRTVWNYVQTQGCCIQGNVPNSDIEKLIRIYDNGVRFWRDQRVGDYNRPNPTSTGS